MPGGAGAGAWVDIADPGKFFGFEFRLLDQL
jgi:hypothetical protein